MIRFKFIDVSYRQLLQMAVKKNRHKAKKMEMSYSKRTRYPKKRVIYGRSFTNHVVSFFFIDDNSKV